MVDVIRLLEHPEIGERLQETINEIGSETDPRRTFPRTRLGTTCRTQFRCNHTVACLFVLAISAARGGRKVVLGQNSRSVLVCLSRRR